MKRLRIILDTNVLIVSIGRNSTYHWLFKLILEGKIDLLISNSILLEYQEIIGKKANGIVAENIIKLLLSLPNVLLIEAYYHWHLVTTDPDDNAFVDAAIAGNAD